mmetsp:Transcript_37137/g.66718  ORF Transcript_37137/g.66718 Transcript_37137/m.66718 type:complete len:82 (+) Transcript_37137:704-949(+)
MPCEAKKAKSICLAASGGTPGSECDVPFDSSSDVGSQSLHKGTESSVVVRCSAGTRHHGLIVKIVMKLVDSVILLKCGAGA